MWPFRTPFLGGCFWTLKKQLSGWSFSFSSHVPVLQLCCWYYLLSWSLGAKNNLCGGLIMPTFSLSRSNSQTSYLESPFQKDTGHSLSYSLHRPLLSIPRGLIYLHDSRVTWHYSFSPPGQGSLVYHRLGWDPSPLEEASHLAKVSQVESIPEWWQVRWCSLFHKL